MTFLFGLKIGFIALAISAIGGGILFLKSRLKKGDKAIRENRVHKKKAGIDSGIQKVHHKTDQKKEKIRNEANKLKNKPTPDNVSAADQLNKLPK